MFRRHKFDYTKGEVSSTEWQGANYMPQPDTVEAVKWAESVLAEQVQREDLERFTQPAAPSRLQRLGSRLLDAAVWGFTIPPDNELFMNDPHFGPGPHPLFTEHTRRDR